MKQGRSIIELAKELERQRMARKDFIADTRNLEVYTKDGMTQLTLGINDTTETFIRKRIIKQCI